MFAMSVRLVICTQALQTILVEVSEASFIVNVSMVLKSGSRPAFLSGRLSF